MQNNFLLREMNAKVYYLFLYSIALRTILPSPLDMVVGRSQHIFITLLVNKGLFLFVTAAFSRYLKEFIPL